MDRFFSYRRGTLCCEGVPLAKIARRVWTPTYVYSRAAIEAALAEFAAAFRGTPHTLCYSVKANSNLALLRLIGSKGTGFDIVSGGELYRVLRAGLSPRRVVFSGVGKTAEEVDFALRQKILFFHLESAAELELVARCARELGARARVAIRVNPDVDPGTHPHISTGQREHKFGVPMSHVAELARRVAADQWLEFVGIGCHIGSQITRIEPFERALGRLGRLAEGLKEAGLAVRYLDIGGGVGIRYDQERVFRLGDYARVMKATARRLGCYLILEPGRSVVARAGVLLARVLVRKRGLRKSFLVLDAGMSDLLRPALYAAYHRILPVKHSARGARQRVDVVGPICETADTFAQNVRLPRLESGDLVVLCDVGAYGFAQASNYNSRPRPAEVLVGGSRFQTIRARENWEDLVRGERPAGRRASR